jgi:hypothetical protein
MVPPAPGIARLAKTKRLHLRPLGVSQNESVHPQLDSQPSPDENPESQQTLVNRSLTRRNGDGTVDPAVVVSSPEMIIRISYFLQP